MAKLAVNRPGDPLSWVLRAERGSGASGEKLAKRSCESGESAVGGGRDRDGRVDWGRSHCGRGRVGLPHREEELFGGTVLALGLHNANSALARSKAAVARAIDVNGEFAHAPKLTTGAGLDAGWRWWRNGALVSGIFSKNCFFKLLLMIRIKGTNWRRRLTKETLERLNCGKGAYGCKCGSVITRHEQPGFLGRLLEHWKGQVKTTQNQRHDFHYKHVSFDCLISAALLVEIAHFLKYLIKNTMPRHTLLLLGQSISRAGQA